MGAGLEIAVVGMSGRFPGANTPDELWRNIREGKESIARLTRDRLLAAGVPAGIVDDPAYVPCKGILEGIDQFDAGLFQIGPREAELMDPQHRLFLECAWEALESAGCDPKRYRGAIGIWAGCGAADYWRKHVDRNRGIAETAGEHQAAIANDKDFLATRTAYRLNLRGPAVTVQTACSTSLVAIGMATRALVAQECDMALAGGVSISLPDIAGYLFQEGMILSPDGHCRAFDARARGAVPADAAAIVVLKRLEEARRDGSRILAVIRGFGMNNDGAAKIGFTAPASAGQAEAIRRALRDAGVRAGSIGYVEAHGTGTELGDPIEIEALTEAYRADTDATGFCAIGSVKTNLGHANTAAGAVGFIKAVQCLEHREIPPSLHFETPNPHAAMDASPFYVNTTLRPWRSEGVRRAGVSSFGIGGTNAHSILQEAPAAEPTGQGRDYELLVLSAATPQSLVAGARRLSSHLADIQPNLADAAFTLQTGRRELPHRRIVVARSSSEAARMLADPNAGKSLTFAPNAAPGVVFLFPGQGSQYPGMGEELFRSEPFFRSLVEECCQKVQALSGIDLLRALYPRPGNPELLDVVAQPALFTIEYALARLLMQWGIKPAAMLGHSVGEYAAACIAGVFDLDAALRLVCERNRLALATAPGAMLAVSLAEGDLREMLPADISLAAVNAPDLCVVSGTVSAIESLERRLSRNGSSCRRLRVARAMHSTLLDPVLDEFHLAVESAAPQTPVRPFISSLTGTWIRPEEAASADYWVRHLRGTMRFHSGMCELFGRRDWSFLEVGPSDGLSSLARRHPSRRAHSCVAAMRRPNAERSDTAALLESVGELWLHGVALDWTAFREGERRRSISLPTYAFDRKRYWIDADKDTPTSDQNDAVGQWFYDQVWTRAAATENVAIAGSWLLFNDRGGLGDALIERLAGHQVTIVEAGDTFADRGAGRYIVDPSEPGSYRALFDTLSNTDSLPDRIVHLWCAAPADAAETVAERLEKLNQTESEGFYSLLGIAQALGGLKRELSTHLLVVTRGVLDVAGSGAAAPERATVLGVAKAIPAEYPSVTSAVLDIPSESRDATVEHILAEACRSATEPFRLAACRGADLWTPSYQPSPADALARSAPPFREEGVYLITGGLGGIGLTLAEWLGRTLRARLVLIGRSALPPRSEWNDAAGEMRRRIDSIRSIEAAGGRVLAVAADVTNLSEMRAAVTLVRETFGPIHGAIHAAGVAGGGIIQRKTRAEAMRVLAPKVRGTLALAVALENQPLDFLVLCSSLTAAIGGFGQADYCAANCFLDAFAQSRAGGKTLVQSIQWDGWQEVGMAARAAEARPPSGGHILFDTREELANGRVVYRTHLDTRRHWVIGDHRVDGRHTLVGTAYVELARAAVADRFPGEAIAISDLVLLSPVVLEHDGSTELVTEVSQDGDGLAIRVRSAGGDRDYMTCRAEALRHPVRLATEPNEWLRRCPRELPSDWLFAMREGVVELGSRWRCIRSIRLGDNEAMARIEAPNEVIDELDAFGVHPALFDIATGFFTAEAAKHVLPFSYGRIEILRPLPARFYAYARLLSAPHASVRRMDILLADEQGNPIVEVRDYCVKIPAARMSA